MSLAATTRDAVIAVINGATLTPKPTAIAIYEVTVGLSTLAGGRIAVMPQTLSPKLATRAASSRRDVTIDVAVQYKTVKTAPADQVTDLDPYLNLSEAIINLLLGKALSNGAVCLEAGYLNGLWLPEHMKEFNVFTSVVSMKFVTTQ